MRHMNELGSTDYDEGGIDHELIKAKRKAVADEEAKKDGWRDAEHRELFLKSCLRLASNIRELAVMLENGVLVPERPFALTKKQKHASKWFQRFMCRCRTMWRREDENSN